ncbi:MAG: sodium-dependent bicarbonate transport family permease [Kangiellaceae bacterium]|nr:sodium-dependent bicarbonate transport family permease [Kangiellaceae bacterium]
MQLDIVVAFFILGFVATLVRSNIDIPQGFYKGLILFLLLAIGLKGGIALQEHASLKILPQVIGVLAFGFILPLIAYPILRSIGDFDRTNAANIAAHYGSVSVATYAVAVAFLETLNIEYEAYFPLFVAILEAPAIAVGIWLANRSASDIKVGQLLHESLLNPGVLLLIGGLLIGYWAGPRVSSIAPVFLNLFHGGLALFLLAMGQIAAKQARQLLNNGTFIACFGILMPLIGALLGTGLAVLLGMSQGGTILMATLGASCSYIAVPAAMSVALPKANHGLAITASLGVTFPFNVIVGIPLYHNLISHFLF